MGKLLILLFMPFLVHGQSSDILGLTSYNYQAISNLTNANEKAKTLDLGINYEFNNKQAQIIYNLTNKYFVFGTYNENNSTSTYKPILGGERKVDILNFGYSVGFGIQNIFKIRNFQSTELLLGLEFQKFQTNEYLLNYPEEKDDIKQNYSKFFAQLNISKVTTNFDFGYSLKLSYFKITSYSKIDNINNFSSLESDFTGKSTLMLDPTVNFNYKLLKNKQLFLTSQIGFSSSLLAIRDKQSEKNIWGGESSLETSKFYFSPILKFGIQYRINFK